jgi:hypothetical protein
VKIRNVTRGESYHFTDCTPATVIWWWFFMGKDWHKVCTVSRWWAEEMRQAHEGMTA